MKSNPSSSTKQPSVSSANGNGSLLLQKYLLLGEIAKDRALHRLPAVAVAYQILEWYGARRPGLAEASHRALAKATGIPLRVIQRTAPRLVEQGHFRCRPGGVDHKPSLYYPNFTAATETIATSGDRSRHLSPQAATDTIATSGGTSIATSGGHTDILRQTSYPLMREERARPKRRIGRMMGGSKTTQSSRQPTAVPAEEPNSGRIHPRPSAAAARRKPTARKMTAAEFENFEPDAEDHAHISENCGAVDDPHGPRWVRDFVNFWLNDKNRVPADPHRAFRTFMDYRQRWATEEKDHRTTPRTGQRRGGSTAMDELFKIRAERLAREEGE
jgi:hypothetical protein